MYTKLYTKMYVYRQKIVYNYKGTERENLNIKTFFRAF